MSRGRPLVRNHERVYDVLRAAGRPLSAYELLDRVREFGISAPPTVYRALDRLLESGRAHRLESLNAYVACGDPGHSHDQVVFAICRDCHGTSEFAAPRVFASLKRQAGAKGFVVDTVVVELKGLCRACAERAAHT